MIFAVLAWYFTWSWIGGPRDARAEIVAAAGRRCARRRPASRRAALARYLAAGSDRRLAVAAYLVLQPRGLGAHAAWLVALNFLFAFVDRDRQFLHDRLAGTRLVVTSR